MKEAKEVAESEGGINLEEAISLLRNTVKYSAVPGQKHIDLSLVSVDELPTYEKALEVANKAVMEGQITRDQLLVRLGLT